MFFWVMVIVTVSGRGAFEHTALTMLDFESHELCEAARDALPDMPSLLTTCIQTSMEPM